MRHNTVNESDIDPDARGAVPRGDGRARPPEPARGAGGRPGERRPRRPDGPLLRDLRARGPALEGGPRGPLRPPARPATRRPQGAAGPRRAARGDPGESLRAE